MANTRRLPQTPARAALIEQAVRQVFASNYPASIRVYGRKEWAEKLFDLVRDDFDYGREFCAAVRRQFAGETTSHRVAA